MIKLVLSLSLLAACASRSDFELPLPEGRGPTVLVGKSEAVIIFPIETQNDFPWPRVTLTDRLAGPGWYFVAVASPGTATAVAAHLGTRDNLTLESQVSLDQVVQRARPYSCDLDLHVISCAGAVRGAVLVRDDQLVLRVTDLAWVRGLKALRPDSAWLSVDRPNRRTVWRAKIPIQYLSSGDGV